jgi:hypothetical protein
MLKSAYIDPKRIKRVEAVAEIIWRGFYDLGMGPRLIAEATVVALIKFVANEAVGHFPGEINRLRKLLEEQADALVEAGSAGEHLYQQHYDHCRDDAENHRQDLGSPAPTAS